MNISRADALTIAASEVRPLANGPKNNKWQAVISCGHGYHPISSSDFIYNTYQDAVKEAKKIIIYICDLVSKGNIK